MFRNFNQRNNLALLLASVLLYYYCKKEVHQNIFETKRLSGVDAEENFRLFTNCGCHGYSGKQMVDADVIGEWMIRKMTLVESC